MNNIFQNETDLVQFGYKKFLTNKNDFDEYVVVVASSIKQNVFMQANLENSENFFILNSVQKKLLSMRLCKFENYIMNDNFNLLLKNQFFQPQEVLDGKNICELCLDQPVSIDYALRQKSEDIGSLEGSLVDDIVIGDENLMSYYLQAGLA